MNSYHWYIGGAGGIIYSGSLTAQAVVAWTQTGDKTISVTYKTSTGCQAETPTVKNVTVTQCDDPVTGIEPVTIPDIFNIYPNPNSGLFNVTLQCSCKSKCYLAIYNLLGVKVYESGKFVVEDKTEMTIDMQSSPAGVYSAVLVNEDQRILRKVIIQK